MFNSQSPIPDFLKSALIIAVLFFTFSSVVYGDLGKDSSSNYWGEYESWSKWKVYVIPSDISKAEFVKVANTLFSENPNQRIRFFDDDRKIKEYIAAEKFAWDTTGQVPRAEFPTEWRKEHLIGIVNDRSNKGYNRWQIIYNKGGVSEHIIFLD